MATKQTRRSFSVSGALYDAVRARAVKDGITGSGFVERELRKALNLPPVDTNTARARAVPATEERVAVIEQRAEAKKSEVKKAEREDDIEPLFGGAFRPTYSTTF